MGQKSYSIYFGYANKLSIRVTENTFSFGSGSLIKYLWEKLIKWKTK